MDWTSVISISPSKLQLSLTDRIVSLGSCFSDEIASKLRNAGFDIDINPFGTLYNPESIANSVARLSSGDPFTEADCVEMGAGAAKICSFSHHSSFARNTVEEFLEFANQQLKLASDKWRAANKVIITLGSAMVWRYEGRTVSNCLKLPARLFTHEMLSVEEVRAALASIVDAHPDKQFIFTISPIRYLSQGAYANSISKASLHLGLQPILSRAGCEYFPAFELMLDELRDYRFYAADMVHPRDIAVDYIWSRFKDFCLIEAELTQIKLNEAAAKAALHRRNIFL